MKKWINVFRNTSTKKKGFSISKIAKKAGSVEIRCYKYLEMNPLKVSEWMAATKVRRLTRRYYQRIKQVNKCIQI